MTRPDMEGRLELLLELLDEDIRHVEHLLLGLDALRDGLIRRQDAQMSGALEEMRRETEAHAVRDRKRQDVRRELAAEWGCDPHDVTLSHLQARLPDGPRRAVADRHARLKALVEALQREYALTAMLVADCARLNRSLLRALFGQNGRDSVTYSPRGATRQQANRSLVSLRL